MMSMDDFAPEALAVLLPYLDGVVAGSEETVDGSNPDYPGQTFNYLVPRGDGPALAVEFVRAWDEVFLDAPDGWDRLCARVQGAVRERHPALVGRYTVGFDTGIAARMKDQKIDELVGAIVGCDTGSRVDLTSGVTVRHTDDSSELTVEPYRVSSAWELGPSSQTALREGRSVDGEDTRPCGRVGIRNTPRCDPLDARELGRLAPVAGGEPARGRPPAEHLGSRPEPQQGNEDETARTRGAHLSLIIRRSLRRRVPAPQPLAPGERLAALVAASVPCSSTPHVCSSPHVCWLSPLTARGRGGGAEWSERSRSPGANGREPGIPARSE